MRGILPYALFGDDVDTSLGRSTRWAIIDGLVSASRNGTYGPGGLPIGELESRNDDLSTNRTSFGPSVHDIWQSGIAGIPEVSGSASAACR